MPILLSCISTKHSLLKRHWSQSDQEKQQTECPLTVLGSLHKPKEDQGGLLALLDEDGQIVRGIEMSMPAGMVRTDDAVLVSTIYDVQRVSADLTTVFADVISLPSFNMLHSLSRTRNGYVIASTGLDAIIEFSATGELLWDWWATEHGFDHTPVGEQRWIEKGVDYRSVKFGTLAQTTHVNSVAELPDGTILATLFHQGTVIAIDRATGAWHTVLEGLDHPHSVRVLNDEYITIADTGHGLGLLVHLKDRSGVVEAQVDAHTNWLQDCSYDRQQDRWLLVDGKQSRLLLKSGATGERAERAFPLDPELRLYEALAL